MKKCKLLLSSLLIGFLISTSCSETRDPSKDIVYAFSADLSSLDTYTFGQPLDLNIMINSDVYNNGILGYEAIYKDNKKSFLISKNGDTILANIPFALFDGNNWNEFKFIGTELGKHNLTFDIKNTTGYKSTINRYISIEDNFPFSLSISSYNGQIPTIKIGDIYEINYIATPLENISHFEDQKYQFSFDGDFEGELSGYNKKNEWNSLDKATGTFKFIPNKLGLHKIKLNVRNQYNIKNSVTIDVNVVNDFVLTDFSFISYADNINYIPIIKKGKSYDLPYFITPMNNSKEANFFTLCWEGNDFEGETTIFSGSAVGEGSDCERINATNSIFKFKANKIGLHKFKITAQNIFKVEKSINIKYMVTK